MLRLASVAVHGAVRLGAVLDECIVDVGRIDPGIPPQLVDLIKAGPDGLDAARTAVTWARKRLARDGTRLYMGGIAVEMSNAQILAPVPSPGRGVFCVGRNYAAHVAESRQARGDAPPPTVTHPEFFTKPPSAVVGQDAFVAIDPAVTERFDYEAELAVVVGRRGRDIAIGDAWSHIFGYSVANDLTARDQQRRHGQWFKGKALDMSCPIGPVVVPHTDIGDPHDLEIALRVNGSTRQHANTSHMMTSIPEVLHWLSQGTTLEPGDVILTGTPAGVGNGQQPPVYLAPDDTVEAEIHGIGVLRTHIVRAVAAWDRGLGSEPTTSSV